MGIGTQYRELRADLGALPRQRGWFVSVGVTSLRLHYCVLEPRKLPIMIVRLEFAGEAGLTSSFGAAVDNDKQLSYHLQTEPQQL